MTFNKISPLKALLGDDIFVKSVSMNYLGTCLMDDSLTEKGNNNLANGKDSQPRIRNPIDRINVTAGELLRYKVPEVSVATFVHSTLEGLLKLRKIFRVARILVFKVPV